MPAVQLAAQSILSIMEDANWLGQSILQWMADSPTSWQIDSEIGDLRTDSFGGPAMITYQRYEVLLESDWLARTLGIELTDEQCVELTEMDNPANARQLGNTVQVNDLLRVGQAQAQAVDQAWGQAAGIGQAHGQQHPAHRPAAAGERGVA